MRGDAARVTRLPLRILGGAIAFLIVLFLGMLEAGDPVVGIVFVTAVTAAGVILAAVAAATLPLLARLRHVMPGFGLRHGMGNVHRPGLRAGSAVLALGLATSLLAALGIYRSSLLAELSPERQGRLPALFAINILDYEKDQVDAFLAERPWAEAELAPMVRARLAAVNGDEVTADDDFKEADGDEPNERSHHFRRREQNLSWRMEPGPAETVIAGEWMDVNAEVPLDGIGEASLEADFADDIGVRIGDELTFTIRGQPITVRVTSLREVRWASFRPNFFILITPSLLRPAAPKWIAAVSIDRPEQRPELQADLVRAFPEVSVFDVADVVTKIRGLLDRIAWAISFLALFALAAGLLVLTGLVAASARQRRQEAALLRTLGAGNGTLLASLGAEFAIIGGLGALAGTGLAMAVTWLGMERALELEPDLPWALAAGLVVVVTALAILVGLLACRRVLAAAPLVVLREE